MLRPLAALSLTAALFAPLAASAEDRAVVPYLSAFGGAGRVPETTVHLTDRATATALDISGRKIDTGAAFGASAGVWRQAGRRLLLGLRADAARQTTDAKAQPALTSAGTLGGRPFAGALPVAAADGSTLLFTAAATLGLRLGGDRSPLGAVTPYVGVGGGVEHSSVEFNGGEDEHTGGVFTALGGVSANLNPRFSVYGEYRYVRGDVSFELGGAANEFTVEPSQFVGGVSFRF